MILNKSNIEYVGHGVNWRTGCKHGCRYCYMAGLANRFDGLMPESGEWTDAEPRVGDPMDALIEELAARRAPQGPLMLSTSHDPAMDAETADESAGILAALAGFNLLERTLYLTKAPGRALTALHYKYAAEGLRFGTSITSMGIWLTGTYEPGAEMPQERIVALQSAANHGYHTWISLEPPLPDVYLEKLVRLILTELDDMRPWIVLGKLNARGTSGTDPHDQDLARWAASPHWADDRDAAVDALLSAGYVESLAPIDGGYWVKKELRECR